MSRAGIAGPQTRPAHTPQETNQKMEEAAPAVPRSFPLLAPSQLLAARFGQATSPQQLQLSTHTVTAPGPRVLNDAQAQSITSSQAPGIPSDKITGKPAHDTPIEGRFANAALIPAAAAAAAAAKNGPAEMHEVEGDAVRAQEGTQDAAHLPTVKMNPEGSAWQLPRQPPKAPAAQTVSDLQAAVASDDKQKSGVPR